MELMNEETATPDDRTGSPSVQEIAALTGRLRALSAADESVRAEFLADKDALLARIAAARDDEPPGDLEMPQWMREQAALAEAERAAGRGPQVRPDDPAALAQRVSVLRARVAEAGAEQDRADQLALWHSDDIATEAGDSRERT